MRARRRHLIVFLGQNRRNAERCIDEHVAKGYEVVAMWTDNGDLWVLMGHDERRP